MNGLGCSVALEADMGNNTFKNKETNKPEG